MKIIDTNILSYKFKDPTYSLNLENNYITSINALEFLQNFEKQHTSKAKYYIPLIKSNNIHLAIVMSRFRQDHPFGKLLADSIIFDFNNDFESFMIYNNRSITETINQGYFELFNSSIKFLSKVDYKDAKEKFAFLLNSNLKCLNITQEDIELSYRLLDLFLKSYSIKENFRNSWNDLLILSKSINNRSILVSNDKLLNKFAADLYQAKITQSNENQIEIDFDLSQTQINNMTKFESKGYINHGWNYKLRNKK